MPYASAVASRFPAILPAGLKGSVLAGPLILPNGPAAVLVLVALGAKEFTANHERIFRTLLEPFTVAFENDHRLRELVTLREAAEAEKAAAQIHYEGHGYIPVGEDIVLAPPESKTAEYDPTEPGTRFVIGGQEFVLKDPGKLSAGTLVFRSSSTAMPVASA